MSVLDPGGMFLACGHLPGEDPDPRRPLLYMREREQLEALRAAGLREPTVRLVSNGMALYRAQGAKMSDISNLEIAQRYISRLSGGAGPEEFETFFAPDAIQEEFPNRLLPNGATRGPQEMKEGRKRGLALLKAESYEVVNAVASGNQVAMELIWTGTVRDAAGPFAAGQVLRARFAIFIDFRDGRIVRQRNYDCFDPW